jgi:hypothetical protein
VLDVTRGRACRIVTRTPPDRPRLSGRDQVANHHRHLDCGESIRRRYQLVVEPTKRDEMPPPGLQAGRRPFHT